MASNWFYKVPAALQLFRPFTCQASLVSGPLVRQGCGTFARLVWVENPQAHSMGPQVLVHGSAFQGSVWGLAY